MPFGIDSRAAMVPGGAAEGFGNLGAALLMAPRMRRQQEEEDLRRAKDDAFRQKQLEQSLQIAQMQDANERARIADANAWHEAQARNETTGQSMKYGNDFAKTIAGGLSGIFGSGETAKQPQPHMAAFNPYKRTKGAMGDEHDELKTPEEIDQERALNKRYLRGAVNGIAPPAATADPQLVAERKARNASAQQQQRAAGLAQFPGDAAPTPSTAGMPGSGTSPLDAAPVVVDRPPMSAPADEAPAVASSGKLVRTSSLRTKVGPGPGQYPDLATAIAEAAKHGHRILRDD